MSMLSKIKFTNVLIIILIILNLLGLYFFVVRKNFFPGDHVRHRRPHFEEMNEGQKEKRSMRFLERELKLSEVQKNQIRELKKARFAEISKSREAIRAQRKVLFTHVGQEEFNVDSVALIIGTTQAEIESAMYAHFNKISEICDDTQKQKLKRLVKRMMDRNERMRRK